MQRFTRWYIPECPCKDECSQASWDRAKRCQSWNSEEECKANLFRHLRTSSLHWATDEAEHRELVDISIVFTEDVECEMEQEEIALPPPKRISRHRESAIGAPRAASRDAKHDKALAADIQNIVRKEISTALVQVHIVGRALASKIMCFFEFVEKLFGA